jgi:predicted permease
MSKIVKFAIVVVFFIIATYAAAGAIVLAHKTFHVPPEADGVIGLVTCVGTLLILGLAANAIGDIKGPW